MTHLRINLKTICANFGPVYGQMFSTGDSVHDVEQCLNISTVSHITTNSQTLSDNFQENAKKADFVDFHEENILTNFQNFQHFQKY